ncbi:zinc finger TRAF-type-containing protein 1 [Pelodytes ibericus]
MALWIQDSARPIRSVTGAQVIILQDSARSIRSVTGAQVIIVQDSARPIRSVTGAQVIILQDSARPIRSVTGAQVIIVQDSTRPIRSVTGAQVIILQDSARSIRSVTGAQVIILQDSARPIRSVTEAQCTNGHLMCAGCFIHLLADARLKEEQATCPNCRCEISKSLCCRNLAVEKAVSELPSECGFCIKQFPRSLLERHKKEECLDRVTQCKYNRIGCPWQGPYHELTVHESECCHPTKAGSELMEILGEMDQTHKKEMQLYNSIFSLLSFEKIGYTEVQFRPYRTDDFITRLYYETPRFTVLNQTWVLKARVNDSERNPNLSCKRTLSFQLILKSKINSPMECSFLLLKGPYDDVKIHPVIYHFVFNNENNETEYVPLPIIDSVECNKLLAAKNINLRLFIFHIQK